MKKEIDVWVGKEFFAAELRGCTVGDTIRNYEANDGRPTFKARLTVELPERTATIKESDFNEMLYEASVNCGIKPGMLLSDEFRDMKEEWKQKLFGK